MFSRYGLMLVAIRVKETDLLNSVHKERIMVSKRLEVQVYNFYSSHIILCIFEHFSQGFLHWRWLINISIINSYNKTLRNSKLLVKNQPIFLSCNITVLIPKTNWHTIPKTWIANMHDLSWPGWVCKLDLSYRNPFHFKSVILDEKQSCANHSMKMDVKGEGFSHISVPSPKNEKRSQIRNKKS